MIQTAIFIFILVKGGLHNLAGAIQTLAHEIGVEIITGSEVKTAITDEGTIEHLILDDGSKIEADLYVSNMEVIPFYTKVLDTLPKNISKMKKKFPPASSGLVIHLGVNKTYPELRHHNFSFPKTQIRIMKLCLIKNSCQKTRQFI